MDTKLYDKYFSWCVDNGITIYPKPYTPNGSVLKIVVNNNGREKIGEEKYTNDSIYEKIKELYRDIFNKYNKSHY